MKKKSKEKYYMPSVYFGFLSGFAIFCFFLIAKTLIRTILESTKITQTPILIYTFLAIIIYIFLLKFSYNYAEYDKDLRKSLLYSSIGLLIIYYLIIGIKYLI